MTKSYNFPDHKSGDTFGGVQFELLVNAVAKNLTGAVIDMEINSQTFSTETGEIEITNAAGGIFQFKSQIVDLPVGNYFYEITIIFSDTSVKTYIDGYWRIIE
jgi:hypothetical protein